MKIVVERFKNISHFEHEFEGVSLLVGGNNSGKSSILQAIQFGISAAQTSQMLGGTWKKDRLSTSISQSDLVCAPIKDVLFLAKNGQLREHKNSAIRITYKEEESECEVSLRRGKNKNILIELNGKTLGERLQSISTPFATLVTGLAGIPTEERFQSNMVVRRSAAKGDSNAVFRNILLQLQNYPEKWAEFCEQFGSIFDSYDVSVAYDENKDESIACHVVRDGRRFPIDTCGTGVLQAIQIFAYISLFSPKMLLLDEPDSHLHPNNQVLLARALEKVSRDGVHIAICSHSRHIIGALLETSDVVWVRDGAVQDQSDEYELRALLEIGALGAGERIRNPDYVVLTEDVKDGAISLLLKSNGFDLTKVEIASYSGCTQIATATALIQHLRKLAPSAKFIVHRDRDFLSGDELEAYKRKFEGLNVQMLIPTGNDLESYFVSAAHLSESCGVGEDEANAILTAALTARRDALLSKYTNTRVENTIKRGEKPDSGQIATDFMRGFESADRSVVHGKTLLKGIRDELATRKIMDRLMNTSSALAIAEIKQMRLPSVVK